MTVAIDEFEFVQGLEDLAVLEKQLQEIEVLQDQLVMEHGDADQKYFHYKGRVDLDIDSLRQSPATARGDYAQLEPIRKSALESYDEMLAAEATADFTTALGHAMEADTHIEAFSRKERDISWDVSAFKRKLEEIGKAGYLDPLNLKLLQPYHDESADGAQILSEEDKAARDRIAQELEKEAEKIRDAISAMYLVEKEYRYRDAIGHAEEIAQRFANVWQIKLKPMEGREKEFREWVNQQAINSATVLTQDYNEAFKTVRQDADKEKLKAAVDKKVRDELVSAVLRTLSFVPQLAPLAATVGIVMSIGKAVSADADQGTTLEDFLLRMESDITAYIATYRSTYLDDFAGRLKSRAPSKWVGACELWMTKDYDGARDILDAHGVLKIQSGRPARIAQGLKKEIADWEAAKEWF